MAGEKENIGTTINVNAKGSTALQRMTLLSQPVHTCQAKCPHQPLTPFHPANLLYVLPPLAPHPHQTPRSHNCRPRQPPPPFRSPKNQPLAHKMCPRYGIRPERELIYQRVGDIVGSIKADERGEEGPGPESTGLERGDLVLIRRR